MVIYPPTKIKLQKSNTHGIGVFCSKQISRGEIIEQCSFLVIQNHRNKPLHVFIDHAYVWPKSVNWREYVLVMGYGSFYNHSSEPNVDWITKENENIFEYFAIKDIKEGEELFINYGMEINFPIKKPNG